MSEGDGEVEDDGLGAITLCAAGGGAGRAGGGDGCGSEHEATAATAPSRRLRAVQRREMLASRRVCDLEGDRRNLDALRARADALYADGDVADALEWYTELGRRGGGGSKAVLRESLDARARCLRALGRTSQARELLHRLCFSELRLEPGRGGGGDASVNDLALLSELAAEDGDVSGAVDAALKAVHVRPAAAVAWKVLAAAYRLSASPTSESSSASSPSADITPAEAAATLAARRALFRLTQQDPSALRRERTPAVRELELLVESCTDVSDEALLALVDSEFERVWTQAAAGSRRRSAKAGDACNDADGSGEDEIQSVWDEERRNRTLSVQKRITTYRNAERD